MIFIASVLYGKYAGRDQVESSTIDYVHMNQDFYEMPDVYLYQPPAPIPDFVFY